MKDISSCSTCIFLIEGKREVIPVPVPPSLLSSGKGFGVRGVLIHNESTQVPYQITAGSQITHTIQILRSNLIHGQRWCTIMRALRGSVQVTWERSRCKNLSCALKKESKLVFMSGVGKHLVCKGLVVTASGSNGRRKGAQADLESSARGDLGSAGGR